MTYAELQAAIAAKSLSMDVQVVLSPSERISACPAVATAREDDGWLYVACEPILNETGEPWLARRVTARLCGDGGLGISESVTIRDEIDVPPGRSLLVAIGLRLQAANATVSVTENEGVMIR